MKLKLHKESRTHLLLSYSIVPLVIVILLLFSVVAMAAGSTSVYENQGSSLKFVTDIFGSEEISGDTPTDFFRNAISTLFRLILSLAGVSAVVLFVIHGTQLIYAQLIGNVASALSQRSRLISVFIGITLLLTSYLILDFVSSQLTDPALFRNLTSESLS